MEKAKRLVKFCLIQCLCLILMSCAHNVPVNQAKKESSSETEVNKKAGQNMKPAASRTSADAAAEDPGRIQKNDLVFIHMTASVDEEIFMTTREEMLKDGDHKSVSWYAAPEAYEPFEFIAGKEGPVPGMTDHILGLSAGDMQKVSIPPEKAYGLPNPKDMAGFPCVKEMPRVMRMNPEEYFRQFKEFPVNGKVMPLGPYVKAEIIKVADLYTDMKVLNKDGEKFEDKMGITTVHVKGDNVKLVLKPAMGALFELDKKKGRIVSSDGETFTVDFNHPLAGKTIHLNFEVLSFMKATEFESIHIDWVESFDLGLEKMKQEMKPGIFVLYADWCKWSKKLLNESVNDPRVKTLKDMFVWVRVNTSENTDIKDMFEQKSFPLTLVMDSLGNIQNRIDGYRDGRMLSSEINKVINGTVVQAPVKKGAL